MKHLNTVGQNFRLEFYHKQFAILLFLLSCCNFYTNAQISIADNSTIIENFDAIGSSATASLPVNWKMSGVGNSAPTWNDGNNFTATNFAFSSGTPTSGGRYNWGKTGGTDRSIGFISSSNYVSPNSIITWCKNTGVEDLVSLTVSYDLYQFRINTGVPTVTFFYSTNGTTWTSFTPGDAQTITTGASAYNFSNPANFGRSAAAGTSAITITGLTVQPGGNLYLRWNFKTSGSSNSEGLALDNVQLTAGFGIGLVRGPYLNLATQNSIIVRWRTDLATDSKVNFGTAAGNLVNAATDNTLTTEHIVQLNGLTPNTQYYYTIGSTQRIIQGDANNYFRTFPTVGSKQKVRVLAMGDMGKNSTMQKNCLAQYLNYNGSNYTDIWMLLGDNAYESGLDSEYQVNFFNIYQQSITKNHVLWPSPGNHEYANNNSSALDHNVDYYKMFSLPKNGEAGGVPSNSTAYYSFDYANIHFVCLDSWGMEYPNYNFFDTLSPQITWLKKDLAANKQKWTVLYFHQPPYSKVSQDSDKDPDAIQIRTNLVKIFERFNVDLILTGHSHAYARSYLLNGHYGLSSTFSTSLYALSTSSAKYDGSANSNPYVKNSTDTRNGIVWTTVGSSGSVSAPLAGWPHPAHQYSNTTNGGTMVIEIEDNRLDAKWVCDDGVIRDNFTMMKEVNKKVDTPILAGSSVTLTASWIGNYNWSTGETTRSITVNPSSTTTYSVIDNVNALKDVFNVTVSSPTAPLAASSSATDIKCNGGNTVVTVSASGGTAPYTGTGTFTVTAGTYNYTVTDANGNTATTNITVSEPAALVASSTAGQITTPGGTTTVTVSASGGTAPYTGTGTFTVTAGTYNYTVTDANGCTAATSITVTDPGSTSPLVANLKMEEGSGTTLVDASDYKNNGTTINSPVWVAGKVGQALLLNGTSQYATVPNSASLNPTTAITLAAWIRPQRIATQYIIKKAVNGTTNGYELSLSNTGKVFFRINQATSGDIYRANSVTSHPTDGTTWMHIAATYDGTIMRLYINGVQEAVLTPGAPPAISTNTLAVGIGAQSNGVSLFQGAIDEARIYNTALSAGEIANLVNSVPPAGPVLASPANSSTGVAVNPTLSWNTTAGATTYQVQVSAVNDFSTTVFDQSNITGTSVSVTGLSNSTVYYWRVRASNAVGNSDWSALWSFTTISNSPLVGNWKMDEGSGTTLVDASDYKNNATTKGSPTWTTGKIGQALLLNGSNQYATVPNNASLNPTTAITLSAWIRPQKVATQYIIKKAVMGTTNGYELSLSNSGKVFFRINQATSGDSYRVNSVASYPTDGSIWMHIAATYDGTVMRLYINGVQNATLTPASPPAISTNTLVLGIGSQSDGISLFQGALDEARIYNTALSAGEIANLATVPSAVTTMASASSFTAKTIMPKEEFTVYPNPVLTNAMVRFVLTENSKYSIMLYDMRGMPVGLIKQGDAKSGELNTVKINTAMLAKGVYIIKLLTNKDFKTLKLIVEGN